MPQLHSPAHPSTTPPVLTGATGLVGSAVLRSMLADEAVSRITILSRRAVPQASGHAKVDVILHEDFADYTTLPASTLSDASGAVWALGISQSAVDKATYEKVTYEYPLAFARYWTGLSDATKTLVFVSGEGVTHQPPSFFTPRFATVKGRAEVDLLNLTNSTSLTVHAARPGGVDPRHDPEVMALHKQFGPTSPKGLLLAAVGAVSPKSLMSPTKPLGEALVELAKNSHKEVRVEDPGQKDWRGGVLRNAELRRLAGL